MMKAWMMLALLALPLAGCVERTEGQGRDRIELTLLNELPARVTFYVALHGARGETLGQGDTDLEAGLSSWEGTLSCTGLTTIRVALYDKDGRTRDARTFQASCDGSRWTFTATSAWEIRPANW